MEDEEEESSTTTTTNPPFWIQQQTNSTTTTTLRRRNHLISGAVSLLFLLLLLLLLFITTSFPILPTSPFSISLPNIISINVFNKGWDSINLTLVLLALLFGFLAQNNPNHDINNLTENNINIGNHVNNNYDDHHHLQSQRAADIGPSSSNPRTIEFDGKIENESVIRGWFEYSDQTDVTYPSDRNTTVDDDDPHWRRAEIGLSKNNRYHDPTVGFGAMIDNEVHKSNESQVSVNTTGVVLEVRDRIAFVSGLDGVTDGEVVEFDEGTIGIVVTSYESKDNVGVALMGGGLSIRKGSFVKATGKIAQVPENVGRVVDVLGDDIEGRCEKRDSEIKEMPPAVRRRKRRTAESVANNGKSSEETSGVEQKSGKTSHRRTKSSGLELRGEKLSHRRAKSGGFERFGTVLLVGDGVARIYGLDEVTTGEIVEFEDGTIGIVTNSESANNVGVVLMGDGLLIQEGSLVKATGKVAEIPDLGSVTNALAKPIDDKGKNYGSESRGVSEERETKRMLPAVRRRTRRTAESIEEKGKSIEETKGFEREAKVIHRKTKRTHEESVNIPLKAEASDEIEPHLYESSPEKLAQDAPPQNERNERKSATRDFLTSLTKRKKKQRQKSIESFDNYDTIIESQPPSPPPPSKGFFSSKKGKGKKVIEVPLPPPSPPPLYVDSQEQKSAPTTTSAHRPPLPVKAQNFERESPERESSFTGAESPLHPIPSPPPPPPFKMSSWKFVVKGDYVNIGSVNSSRSVSPEREEVDSPIISSESVGGDVATGSMFCPSPDVNSKADMFIAKFREGLKLQKMNSMKMKQGVGLSNLGPVSSIDQAQA